MYRLNLAGITAKPPKWQITVELRKWCVGLYYIYESLSIMQNRGQSYRIIGSDQSLKEDN